METDFAKHIAEPAAEPATEFAAKIAELGISQAHFQQICRFVGIRPATDSTLSQWNKGHREPNQHAIGMLNMLIMFPEMRDAINRGVAVGERTK